MTRDELATRVLHEVAWQDEEVQTRPRPPTWQTWATREYEIDLEHGPRYSPMWFGDLTATEAGRVRVLRAVYRLATAGLVDIGKSEGGRLERVRLTAAGRDAVAGMLTCPHQPPVHLN